MKEAQTAVTPAADRVVEKRPRRGWAVTGICSVLVIMVVIVFGQTVRHEFVNYDDDLFVAGNGHVLRGLTWKNAGWALTAGMSKSSADIDYWRPVSLMSHMLDVQLLGLNAGAHHAMSVGIHALTTVALLLVLCSMTGMLWRSAFVAAVFAIHPLHVESVAWVAERKDVLSALFFVLTLGAYARYARRPFHLGNYLLVVGMFALGLMSKPMVVTLPCVLLLLDYWPLGRLGSVPVGRLLLEKAPLLAMSAAVAVLTTKGPGGSNEVMMTSLPLSWRVANAVVAYGTYLWQTVWPAGLACLYPHPGKNLSLGSVALASVVLMAITAGVIWQRKRRYLVVGWLWYVGMLVPVIGILQSGMQGHADRYTYLPQIGLCLAGTWVVADWAGELRHRYSALGSMAVVLLSFMIVVACHQASYWRDSKTLWTHTLGCTQNNPPAHKGLGDALQQQGRTEEAITQFREALQIEPAYADAHNNLGASLLKQGHADEAIAQFREALRINPAYVDARNNLGNALLQQGQTEEAIAQYREALRINPAYADAHYNLGNTLLQHGQTEEAIAQFREALRLNPAYPQAHYNLGNALHQQGQTEEAIAQFRETLQIDPGNAEARNNLGNAFFQQGRLDEAIAQYREALRINPAYADAHYNLGNALLQQGRMEEAIAQFREALRLNPAYAQAQYNLGNVLFAKGQTEQAIEHLQKALELQPANADIQTNLAAVLATAPQPSLRQGARAVELATQASQSSGGNNPRVLRTLAAAYAAAGKFPNAVQTAQHALQLTQAQSNNKLAEALRREIKLYEAGQPYREGQ